MGFSFPDSSYIKPQKKKKNAESITILPIVSNYVAVLFQFASVASWDCAETDDAILPENFSWHPETDVDSQLLYY